jgi:hypothetical protein
MLSKCEGNRFYETLQYKKKSYLLRNGNVQVILSWIISISILIILWPTSIRAEEFNLINKNYIWRATDAGKIFHRDNSTLNFVVKTNSTDKIYNRAILQTKLNYTQSKPLLLSLNYSSQSITGKAIFYAEITTKTRLVDRNVANDKVLWAKHLNNTMGAIISDSYVIPSEVTNKPIEFKFYIITNSSGLYALNVKKAELKDAAIG